MSNAVRNNVCNTVSNDVLNGARTHVQNQNQNQRFCSCGFRVETPIPRSLHLGGTAALGIGGEE